MRVLSVVVLCGMVTAGAQAQLASITPSGLKCEYKVDPTGIEAASPRLSWNIVASQPAQEQSAWQILVAVSPESLGSDMGDLWDSGKVSGRDTLHHEYGGKPLASRMTCYWKVRVWDKNDAPSAWSAPARWTMGLLAPGDWSAQWIGYDADAPAEPLTAELGLTLPPPPFLRKEFAARPGIHRATIYATALGLYELHLNGKRVGNQYFTPGWTDYGKRVYYNTYDVTGMLAQGQQNVLGAILADGWYAGYIGFRVLNKNDRPRNFYGGEPRLRVQLEIEYDDGSTERVVTDDTWRAVYGPILEADLQMGETQDLRRELRGWDQPGIDTSTWQPVVIQDGPSFPVQAHPGRPVERFEEFPAKSVKEVKPGVFVYDLGQNMVGWARLRVSGAAGDRVQVRHAEMLEPDGGLYTIALRKARAIDAYYLKGETDEILEPRFTFHGFRYVEVTGLKQAPEPKDVVGVVVRTPIQQTGFFECSEPLLNQLFHNIVWGQRGNYLEIPTDCPQRDERLGWTGDAQFFMPTAAYLADVGAFFTKWLVDLAQDSQLADGSWADVAPNVDLGGGNVAWGDAAIICTYQMYQYYADKRVVEQHYDQLVKGMQFLEGTSKDFIRSKMGYGDWLNLGGNAKDEVICTAYFAYLAGLMKEMGEIIGRDADAKHYAELQENIKKAFVTNFVKEDGSILESSQTGYALAFTMNLLPDDVKAKAAERFVQEIARFDNHLATGFIGTPRLLPALSLAGRQDVAYQLLLEKTFPSWLFQVTLGATTMWERWDGWTPDKGFQDPGMNSFNHYAFGAVGEYLFKTVGGIRSAAPGFARIILAPKPGGGLTWAKTRYDSAQGTIRSEWTLEKGAFSLEVEVPANTSAEVELPVPSGTPIEHTGGDLVSELAGAADASRFSVSSGVYTFRMQYPGK